jgi:hypothetical protein
MKPEEILKTEFSEDFIQKMKNRIITSHYKYGWMKDSYNRKHKEDNVNAIATLKKRLELYEETGNTEWLVDVGNFAMIEFMYPQHPCAHFRATSSEESPGLVGISSGEIKRFKEGLK